MTLYHRHVYMPQRFFNYPNTIFQLAWSPHALDELSNDEVDFFATIQFSGKNILEIEVVDSKIKSMTLRFNYDKDYDLYVVLVLESNFLVGGDDAVVKTVYLKSRDRFMFEMNNGNSKKKELYYKPVNMR